MWSRRFFDHLGLRGKCLYRRRIKGLRSRYFPARKGSDPLPKQARYQLRYTRLFSFLFGWAYSPKPGAIPASLYPDMRVSADKHSGIIAKAAGECKHFLILKKN